MKAAGLLLLADSQDFRLGRKKRQQIEATSYPSSPHWAKSLIRWVPTNPLAPVTRILIR